jgi:predicted RNA binding protein YcfA (HicA-like mRNA interferase family)
MAKLRKLVKTLEAAGWVEVTRRDGFAQWRHAGTGRRVTLPLGKATLPPSVADDLLVYCGLPTKEA